MKDLEQDIQTYLAERGWNSLRPSDLAKSISIEAAEFLELFQWDNPTLLEVKNDPERLERIRSELADIFLYALDVSVLLELDTELLIREKLEKVKKKYPAHTFLESSSRVEPGSKGDTAYWDAKRTQRLQDLEHD